MKMIRKLQDGPNVVLATIPQTGHLAKRKITQMADAVCVRLRYTCTGPDEGEVGYRRPGRAESCRLGLVPGGV